MPHQSQAAQREHQHESKYFVTSQNMINRYTKPFSYPYCKQVNGAQYEKFQTAYSNIIKAYMDALQKKDRKAKVQQKKKKPAAAASKLKPSA